MSKVMPSGIAKASGMSIPQVPRPVPTSPVVLQPPVVSPQPVNVPLAEPARPEPSPQLEFDFDKKARYEDVIEAIEKLEKKIIILNEKVDQLLTDKKKLTTNETNLEHGNQTG